ncbi:S8 family serine peptidase, partial [Streptomyces sp. SID625]|nr:S8 family serine peptidase [Streptomyces sp. SID625]
MCERGLSPISRTGRAGTAGMRRADPGDVRWAPSPSRTGDRVMVTATGQVTSVRRAKGRKRVPFSVRRTDGHTHVVPGDAELLLAKGELDPRLFDVTMLPADGYDDAHRPGVPAERNVSDSSGTTDHYGHGTHVASIVAGTGAGSGARYKGVAPGVKLLVGKVIDDHDQGEGSGIVAGTEWAVAQGADIVDLSLGAEDTPDIDPLEEAVNRLSAEDDTLFVVAAGKE